MFQGAGYEVCLESVAPGQVPTPAGGHCVQRMHLGSLAQSCSSSHYRWPVAGWSDTFLLAGGEATSVFAHQPNRGIKESRKPAEMREGECGV